MYLVADMITNSVGCVWLLALSVSDCRRQLDDRQYPIELYKHQLWSIPHCKNIRISTDILWRVFHILTEPVPYTFVSVIRRNTEARVHIAMWTRASLFCRITDTNGTGSVKNTKIFVDIQIFLQCILLPLLPPPSTASLSAVTV